MPRLIVKVGDFIIKKIFNEIIIDEKIIKQKIKYYTEVIVYDLIFLILNLIISCVPEIIPFKMSFETITCFLVVFALFNSLCVLYYVNK